MIFWAAWSLAGLIVIVVGVLLALLIAARIVRADRTIRIARLGVFVERQRVVDLPPADLEPDELDPDDANTVELRRWPRDNAP